MKRLKVTVYMKTGETIRFKARKVMALQSKDGLGAIDFVDAPDKPLYRDISEVAAIRAEAA